MMLAPWVLLPVILALDGRVEPPSRLAIRVLAARAAVGRRADGRGQRRRDVDRLPGRCYLVGLPPAEPAVVAIHRAGGWSPRWRPCGGWSIGLLGRISPPFLDFIESSGVTTQWTSLTEVLRGTDSWTPFVRPAPLRVVTGDQSVAILATTLVAAAGLAGLAVRSMPARDGW